MKFAVIVSDGPGVRNFVLGSFLADASARADVLVLHPIPDTLLDRYEPLHHDRVRTEPLVPFTDTALSFTLRNTLAYAQMYWADTGAMRYNRRARIVGSWKTRCATRTARAAGRVAAGPVRMHAIDHWHLAVLARSREAAHYRRMFQRTQPSVVFCSNQRAPIAGPILAAARTLRIPTAAFIFSWDNITSKGRIIAPVDHYLVWSPHMRDELLRFYPDVIEEQVHVVGTPQFDPYADPAIALTRTEFIRRIGGDPDRPLICYSGGDPTVYTAEHEYVRLLMRMIRDGRVRRRPQVVLRPSPADDGRQYASVRKEFPELLWLPPAWAHTRPGDWSRIVPLPDDVVLLANLTRHSDVNINLNSTMTLDFALRDRPVVNIAFDVLDPPPFGQPLWDFFYQFDHYHPVIELGAARVVRAPEQFAEALNAYLDDPSLDHIGRARFAELEVSGPIGASSNRIVAALAAIAGAATRSQPTARTLLEPKADGCESA